MKMFRNIMLLATFVGMVGCGEPDEVASAQGQVVVPDALPHNFVHADCPDGATNPPWDFAHRYHASCATPSNFSDGGATD